MDLVFEFLLGVAAGLLSGLAGVGGGVLLIPVMVFVLGVPQHTAQGTSSLIILFTSLAGTIVNLRNRRLEVKRAAFLGLGGVASAYLGARLANRVDAEVLRRLFGILVIVSGLRMTAAARQPRPPTVD